jgi:hypothetical protein
VVFALAGAAAREIANTNPKSAGDDSKEGNGARQPGRSSVVRFSRIRKFQPERCATVSVPCRGLQTIVEL